jgi:hypothetical protein
MYVAAKVTAIYAAEPSYLGMQVIFLHAACHRFTFILF